METKSDKFALKSSEETLLSRSNNHPPSSSFCLQCLHRIFPCFFAKSPQEDDFLENPLEKQENIVKDDVFCSFKLKKDEITKEINEKPKFLKKNMKNKKCYNLKWWLRD